MKTCNHNNCNNPQFGGGYCRYHQNSRTDKKPVRLQKKPSGKGSLFNDIITEAVEKDRFRDTITGESLQYHVGMPTMMSCCPHILPAWKYPLFKLYRWNVCFMSPENHTMWDDHRADIVEDNKRNPNFLSLIIDEKVLLRFYKVVEQHYTKKDLDGLDWRTITRNFDALYEATYNTYPLNCNNL